MDILKGGSRGQGIVEYAIILVLVGVVVVGLMGFVGAWILNFITVPLFDVTISWWQAIIIWTIVAALFGRRIIKATYHIHISIKK